MSYLVAVGRRTLARYAVFAFLTVPLAAQDSDKPFHRSYALVIGIDRYSDKRWPTLQSAVADAKAMADYFRSQDYEVVEIYNQGASKQAILRATRALARKLTPRDRVAVFFAGHGEMKTNGVERGYLIPHDATESDETKLSQADLLDRSSELGAARHQLFLVDACYSGSLAAYRGISPNPGPPTYIKQISAMPTREILTAGGKHQMVLDMGPDGHSPFASALLRALRDGDADLDGDGFITFAELTAYLLRAGSVGGQTPASATLPGHEGGEYWFTAPVRPSKRTLLPEPGSLSLIPAFGERVGPSASVSFVLPHRYENYRAPAETRLAEQVVEELNHRDYRTAVRDLEVWERIFPTSDLGSYRRVLQAFAYHQVGQFQASTDIAEGLIKQGLDALFPGESAAGVRFRVLAAAALSRYTSIS